MEAPSSDFEALIDTQKCRTNKQTIAVGRSLSHHTLLEKWTES